ncbi:MAG TPA: hypothetical protein VHN18_11500 [Micromonosporaceae bacterium]|nr:hypothetical protein [Micromonosporaceae bacterium]
MADQERRRRRLRQRPASEPAVPGQPEQSAVTAGIEDSITDPHPGPRPTGGGLEEREIERGLRGLVGSGASQVGTGAALRARDAARPTAADLAEAEARLVVVRRNWTPRDGPGRGR